MRAVVTAGGTSEPIDDVRVITNLSTGRFGASLANALAERGIEVTLLASRALSSHPDWVDPRVRMVPFRSFADLDEGLAQAVAEPPDFLFMAAAVSDYSPAPAEGKISSSADELTLTLKRNPKLLSTLRERCGPATYLVGFKLLSGVDRDELVDVARRQVVTNDLDLTFANDLAELDGERHPAWLVAREGPALRVEGTKAEVAHDLVRVAVQRGLRTVGLADLRALTTAGDRILEAPTEHPGGARLFERHPSLRAVVHLPRGLILPTTPTPLTWRGRADDEAPITAALAREAWAGRWRGGGFAVRLIDGGALVALTESGLWGLGETWARTLDGWREAAHQLGVGRALDGPGAPVSPAPVWHGSRLVGVTAEVPTSAGPATALWIHPDARRQGRGDALYEHLSAHGRNAWAHRGMELRSWFDERGWVRVVDEADHQVLQPPSTREGLTPATSVCLLDPLRRRVLLGQRRTPPWRGYWAFPGGAREGAETSLETGLRELAEETGIVLPPSDPLLETHLVVGGRRGYAVVNYVLAAFEAPPPAPRPEFTARWVDLDEAGELTPMAAGTRRVLARLARAEDLVAP